MRCLACDKRLNNRESTRKYSSSGTYIDLCDRCFSLVAEEIPDVADGINPDDFDDAEDFDSVDKDLRDFGDSGLSTSSEDSDNG